MKIEFLSMTNFRNFFGPNNEITFSLNSPSVIYATNGGGKSTILNAFTWILYNEFTPGLTQPKVIVNKRAIAEANEGEEISAIVKLKFSDNGTSYVITKTETVIKLKNGEWEKAGDFEFDMQSHNGNGNWSSVNNPNATIGRVMPKSLHNYFFFDGERMEKMVSEKKAQKSELRNAAKILLSLEIIDRGIKHLKNSSKTFEKELTGSGNSDFTDLITRKNKADDDLEKINTNNELIEKEQEKCNAEIAKIDKKLESLEETKELQERRNKIISNRTTENEALIKVNKKIKSQISKSGYLFFTKKLVEECNNKIEAMRVAGELPKGIKKQFVEDLLLAEKCICHTPLIDGSEERKHVEAWKAKAGIDDVEQDALNVGAKIKTVNENLDAASEAIQETLSLKGQLKNKLILINDELDEISESIRNAGVTEEQIQQIDAFETKRDKFLEDQENLQQNFNQNTGKIILLTDEIAELDKKIQRVNVGQNKVKLAKKRLQACNDTVKVLELMLQGYEYEFKKDLQNTMRESFSKITSLPYFPVIHDDFTVSLMENTSGHEATVPASTGEKQVLSVSFILGLIEEVKNHVKEKKIAAQSDPEYPIVLDSPFGALGSIYRTGVARYIPSIADQTIILVSETQWRDEVEKALSSYKPKVYCLTKHNPKAKKDLIGKIGNKEVALQVKSDKYEYSSIMEI
jgi:DNA sulfur modification protein DndD